MGRRKLRYAFAFAWILQLAALVIVAVAYCMYSAWWHWQTGISTEGGGLWGLTGAVGNVFWAMAAGGALWLPYKITKWAWRELSHPGCGHRARPLPPPPREVPKGPLWPPRGPKEF